MRHRDGSDTGEYRLNPSRGRGFIIASLRPWCHDPVTTAQCRNNALKPPVGKLSGRLHARTVCELFLCFWIRHSTLPRSSPVPSHAEVHVRRCAGRKAGKTPTNFLELLDADCGTFLPDEDGKSEKPRERGRPLRHPAPSAVAPITQGKTIGGHIGLATANKEKYSDPVTMSFCLMTTAPPAPAKEKSHEWWARFPC